MDVIINFFKIIGKYLKNSATDISKTFTGADSGAVLVMIIFYLVLLIALIFLLKAFIKVIKSFYKDIFSKKKNTLDNSNKKSETSVLPSETNVAAPRQLFEDFNSQDYLPLLTDKYNAFNDSEVSLEVFQPIVPSTPKLLAVDGIKKKIELSNKEIEEISFKFNNKNLAELQQLLKSLTDEANAIEDKITALNTLLASNCQNREKLIEDELSVSEKHNSFVDELKTVKSELDNTKVRFAVEYSQLFNFISDLDVRKQELSEQVKKINEDILTIPGKIKDFGNICEDNSKELLLQFSQKETLINTFKDSFKSINASRINKEEEILNLQSDIDVLLKNKLLCEETINALKPKIEEAERIAKAEAEKKAREEAERLACEKAEAERLERERLAKEEADRLEKERIEREKAEQRAKEEAEKLEQERIAREKAEKLEKERAEQKRAELAEKFETERKVREEEELAAQEKTHSSEDMVPDDESDDFVDVSDVVEKVQKQSQNAYVLNYEDISPEMYKKLARGSHNRKINVMKPVTLENNNLADTPSDVPVSSEEKPKENPSYVESVTVVPVEEIPSAGDDCLEETVPEQKVDHIAELKKQWAAEKAHKQEWAAEKARMKAEEERRKKELEESQTDTTSNN